MGIHKEFIMKKTNDIRIDTSKLHPYLNYLMKKGIKKCNAKGIYLIITEGFRTVAYQNKLYAKGRTAPGSIVTNAKGTDYASQHQWGIAFDIAINGTSKELYNADLMRKASKCFKEVGLSWGGDWTSPVDFPHFYLGKWGDTTSKLKRKFGTPTKFKKYWKRKVKKKTNLYKNRSMTKKVHKIKKGGKMDVLWYSKLGIAKVIHKGKVGYVYRNKFAKIS